MVDTAASYASLIRRIAPDEQTYERILNNRVFQAVSKSLARSHAYVAMERLYDAMQNHDYDLVVLDEALLTIETVHECSTSVWLF